MDEIEELRLFLNDHDEEHLPEVKEWFLQVLQQDLIESISPAFWAVLPPEYSQTKPQGTSDFPLIEAVNLLMQRLQPYLRCMILISEKSDPLESIKPNSEKTFRTSVLLTIKALLFYHTPPYLKDYVKEFYYRAYWAFHKTQRSLDVSYMERNSSANMNVEMDSEEDNSFITSQQKQDKSFLQPASLDFLTASDNVIMSQFQQLNKDLHSLGLLERVCGEAVTSIIHERIEEYVEKSCKGEFESSYLQELEQWLQSDVVSWLATVFCHDQMQSSPAPPASLTTWNDRLQQFLYQTYAKLRISELFNIIVEYPDSMRALEDLKLSLEKTDLRSHLIQSLKMAMETRLLHPGVNTSDILTQYVSSIRALRVLDPAGVILELVCEPVRRYLRTRDNTVRCIVSSLTEDKNSDLAEELAKANPVNIGEGQGSDDADDDSDPFKWEPDPVDADPDKNSSSNRSSDILSMLVNIYGSRELFVNEYKSLLADRILTNFSYETEREMHNLELLKLRFGESQLHHCEVMLKDVADSRRINSNIHSSQSNEKKQSQERDENNQVQDEVDGVEDSDEKFDFNAMILSAQFWPNLKEENLVLHDKVQTVFKKYTSSYEALKAMRTLNWKPHLGVVNLDLELKDRTLSLSVSPLHATIIMHFQDRNQWTIEELSSVMHVPCTALRRKIAFWQSQGVIKEEQTDCFTLIEEKSHKSFTEGDDMVLLESDDEEQTATASAQDQLEEELQVFWSYIVGMLTNLVSLPIERIHSMLKMFALQGPTTSEISEQELRVFLDKKVKEQLLIFSGGVYKLPKSGS